MWEIQEQAVPYFGVLRIRILLFRVILNAARRPPRPGRMLGGRHDARSGAFAFAGYRGAAFAG